VTIARRFVPTAANTLTVLNHLSANIISVPVAMMLFAKSPVTGSSFVEAFVSAESVATRIFAFSSVHTPILSCGVLGCKGKWGWFSPQS
jgi:hypothetical protein